ALLEQCFAAFPQVADRDIKSLDALGPTLEWFNALIVQERYDDAHRVFFGRLATPLVGCASAASTGARIFFLNRPPPAPAAESFGRSSAGDQFAVDRVPDERQAGPGGKALAA